MKLLYAAGPRIGSYYQLKRFLQSIAHQNHTIKLAAYKTSSGNLNIDYTLDSLHNFTNQESGNPYFNRNNNYAYYHNELKRFAPDLIISDFELHTSILATELGIPIWQVSPLLLFYGMNNQTKFNSRIFKNYSHLIRAFWLKRNFIKNMLSTANRKFIPSHLADTQHHDILMPGYEWVRPNFILGEGKPQSMHLAVLPQTNKEVISILKTQANSTLFSTCPREIYPHITHHDIEDESTYKTKLQNTRKFIADGTSVFLADAFYNGHYSLTYPRYDDLESIIGSCVNEYFNLGKITTDFDVKPNPINITINNTVKFLSEHLENL